MGLHLENEVARRVASDHHLSKLCSKWRNAYLLHAAHHKRKLWEFLDPLVQIYTPVSSVLFMTSC
jgi:hypothetical protein